MSDTISLPLRWCRRLAVASALVLPSVVFGQSFVEDFSSATLSPPWSVVVPANARQDGFQKSATAPANHFSLTDSAGHLRFYVDPMTHGSGFANGYSDLFSTYWYDPSIELHRKFNGERWILEVKANYFMPPANGRSFFHSVAYGDGGPGTKSVGQYLYRDIGTTGFVNWADDSSDRTELGDGSPSNLPIYSRIQREGNVISTSWSRDGTNWTPGISKDFGTSLNGLQQRLILNASSWFVTAGSYADYDYIELDVLDGPSPGGSWSPVGSPGTPRASHQATLLNDGRVLVSGGQISGIGVSASEVFDPQTNIWSPTGNLVGARYDHTSTLLTDGRVLAVGGVASNACSNSTSAELYDPRTGTWSAAPNVPVPVGTGHSAIRLADGRVLVSGGGNRCGGVFRTSAVFDPVLGVWTTTGSLTVSREFHSSVLLPDGRVLAAGGVGQNQLFAGIADAEVFDPANGSWSAVAPMNTARQTSCNAYMQPYLAPLPGGRVLAAAAYLTMPPLGCLGSQTRSLSTGAEVFDLASGQWAATASMGAVRALTTLAPIGSGKVLVAGGFDGSGVLATAEIYDAGSGNWTTIAPMGVARSGHTATALSDGRVLVVSDSSAEVFTPETQPLPNRPPIANPGTKRYVPLQSTVTLNGSASFDPDGDSLSYLWRLMSKPFFSQATLAGATTVSPTFVADVAGNYLVRLDVRDPSSATSSALVTIVAGGNRAPRAVISPFSGTITAPGSVVLDGRGSSDPDGDPITYRWTLGSGIVGAALLNADSARPTLNVTYGGRYVVSLIVSDGKSASSPVTLSVAATGPAPPTPPNPTPDCRETQHSSGGKAYRYYQCDGKRISQDAQFNGPTGEQDYLSQLQLLNNASHAIWQYGDNAGTGGIGFDGRMAYFANCTRSPLSAPMQITDIAIVPARIDNLKIVGRTVTASLCWTGSPCIPLEPRTLPQCP